MATTNAPIVQCNVTTLPLALRKLPQWVVWRLEAVEGRPKPAKMPYDPRSGKKARADDPKTWATFEAAKAALIAAPEQWHGLGFYFWRSDPFVGIDLDDAVKADGPELEDWAIAILDRFPGAYVEHSQSGRGLHIVVRANGDKVFGPDQDGGKKGKIEIYAGRHYLALTGDVRLGYNDNVGDGDETDNVVALAEMTGIRKVETVDVGTKGDAPSSSVPADAGKLTAQQVIDAIDASKDKLRFFGLMETDSHPGRASEEDLQLASIIARHTRDEDTIVEIMSQSGRQRPKWSEKRNGTSWLRMTVRRALKQTSTSTATSAEATFRLLDTTELEHEVAPDWLLDPIIPSGALAVLYGPSEGGKSFLALKWALELARDGKRVVYVASEGWYGTKKRVHAWNDRFNQGKPTPLVTFMSGAVNLTDDANVAAFRRAVLTKLKDQPPHLVILDTLNQNMPGGDENNPKDMSAVIAAANLFRRDGTTVLILHHPRKSDEVERGHSSLRNAADTMLQLLKDDVDGHRVLRCTKQKDAAPFEAKRWALVEYGHSMVLEPRNAPDFAVKLEGGIKECVEALAEIEPASHSDWKSACLGRNAKAEGSFNRWVKVLVDQHLVTKDGAKYRVASQAERERFKASDDEPTL